MAAKSITEHTASMLVTMPTDLGVVEFSAAAFGGKLKLSVPYMSMSFTRDEARSFLDLLTKVVKHL